MRNTYVLIGISALIVLAGAWYAFNRSSMQAGDTAQITSSTSETMTLSLTSPAFQNSASIPSQFTCDAENVSPPLSISGVPAEAKSLALIVDDPDVPKALKPDGVFDHWTLFNIAPDTTAIPQATAVGIAGANGAGKNQYTGPCPPREYEPSEHRYFFRLYALDAMLDLPTGASKADVLSAMEGHILAETELMGKYKRISE